MKKSEHHLLLVWCMFCGLIAFILVLALDSGWFHLLLNSDRSKISLLILLLFVVGILHCGRQCLALSRQLNTLYTTEQLLQTSSTELFQVAQQTIVMGENQRLPNSYITEYVLDLHRAAGTDYLTGDDTASPHGSRAEIFATRVKNGLDFGWFLTDSLVKLGLLGTIVGFILMLSSVADLGSIDVNAMQNILKEMSNGMGTALYTTLTGISASLLLAAQYQHLEQGANELIERSVHLAEFGIYPRLQGGPKQIECKQIDPEQSNTEP